MQIGEAVRAVGLEPEFYSLNASTPFASLVYAYVSAGIPLILGAEIEQRGLHAISIVGYSTPTAQAPNPESPYQLVRSEPGQHIDKIYVHDDGIGPFASTPIIAAVPGIKTQNNVSPPVFLDTDWTLVCPVAGRSKPYFMPEWIIVPAYPKIRVPFFAVHSWISRLANMFEQLRGPFSNSGIDVSTITWDIRLALINDFKTSIRDELWDNTDARLLSQEPLPRFIWRGTMFIGGAPSWLLVFDATDTWRTCPLMYTVWLADTHRKVFEDLFADPKIERVWRIPLTPQLYDTIKAGRAHYLLGA
jgi:hypothetical protein